VLRRLLSFEMSRGVLTFTASEDVVHHPGYSVVTAIRPLQAIPIGLFDACFDDLCFLDGVLNSTIERIEWEYAHPLEQKGNTLPAAALNALNQIRTSSTDEHANV